MPTITNLYRNAVKATMRYHLTSINDYYFKNARNNKQSGCGKPEPLCTVVRIPNGTVIMDTSIVVSQNLKTELLYGISIPLLIIYQKELKAGPRKKYLYPHVQSTIIYNT
jgi:hypothetical protein